MARRRTDETGTESTGLLMTSIERRDRKAITLALALTSIGFLLIDVVDSRLDSKRRGG